MAELESTEEMQRALDESVTDAHSGARARYPHLHIDTTRGREEADTLKEATYAEIDHYSITPRTFESRTYDDFAGIYGLIYSDEFAFDSNRVTRFGINSRNVEVDSEKQILAGEPVIFYDPKSQETSSQSTNAIQKLAASISHHPLEIKVVTEALNHLFAGESTKTVLIDVFARINGKIKILASGEAETHTVLLYKNPPMEGKYQILVIDPSNFSFSSHLSNLSELLKSDFANLENIVTLHRSLQIYKDSGEEGPYYHQYRDCIDVAVKLAFNLSEAEDSINLMQITEYKSIKAISNIPKIDKTILDTDIPVRIKQTSDVNIVHQFNAIEKVLRKNFHILEQLDEAEHDQSRTVHTKILETEDTAQSLIGKLVSQNQNIITCISDNLNSEQSELITLIGVTGFESFTEEKV